MTAKRVSAKGAASKVMEGSTLESLLGTEAPDSSMEAASDTVVSPAPPAEDTRELEMRIAELEAQLKQAQSAARRSADRAKRLEERAVKAEEELKRVKAERANEASSAEPQVDVGKFLEALKTTMATRSGTSHYVAETIDEWLEETKAEFRVFGRAKGPNEAGAIWNMGVLLLKEGLDAIPDWRERVRRLAHSPDLALVEMYKLAIQGVRSKL